jgi:hypothetical protein
MNATGFSFGSFSFGTSPDSSKEYGFTLESPVDTKPPTSTLTNAKQNEQIGNMFNKQEFSDCNVVFEKSGKTLSLHKIILCAQSDFFKTCFASGMMEAEKSTIHIAPEEDEKLITNLLEALYTSSLAVDSADIMTLIMLTEKYLLTTWSEQLVDFLDTKATAEHALQCVQLNLDTHEQVKNVFEKYAVSILEDVLKQKEYLTLEAEQIIALIRLIVNNINSMDGLELAHSWIAHHEQDRAEYSYALMTEVQNGSKRFPEVGAMFNPNLCGVLGTLSNHNKTLQKKTEENHGWNLAALGVKCNRYKVRVEQGVIMLGFAPSDIRLSGGNYRTNGYYLYVNKGSLYSQNGEYDKPYCVPAVKCTVEAILHNQTIRFVVNGVDYGVAFQNVRGDLYPAFELHDMGTKVEYC